MRFSITLNFPVCLLWLVSEQLGMFYLLHDTECAPRRKETSKTLLFLHSRFNKTHRRVHTQEMWVACADLSNTYSEKSLLMSLSLMMRSAEKKKKKASEPWDSARVRGRTLLKVTTVGAYFISALLPEAKMKRDEEQECWVDTLSEGSQRGNSSGCHCQSLAEALPVMVSRAESLRDGPSR